MQAKLRSVDCILELHDARIPFSGRNPNFAQNLVGDKPHILILNKSDLITREAMRSIRDLYERRGTQNVVFTNSKFDQDSGIKKVIIKI
jgi:ribosome biogenesis GTPase A